MKKVVKFTLDIQNAPSKKVICSIFGRSNAGCLIKIFSGFIEGGSYSFKKSIIFEVDPDIKIFLVKDETMFDSCSNISIGIEKIETIYFENWAD